MGPNGTASVANLFLEPNASGAFGEGTLLQQTPASLNLNALAGIWAFGLRGETACYTGCQYPTMGRRGERDRAVCRLILCSAAASHRPQLALQRSLTQKLSTIHRQTGMTTVAHLTAEENRFRFARLTEFDHEKKNTGRTLSLEVAS